MAAGESVQIATAVLKAFSPAPYMITFWYHSYGEDMSTLRAYEMTAIGVNPGPLWVQPTGTNTSILFYYFNKCLIHITLCSIK